MAMKKEHQFNFWYFALALMGLMLFQSWYQGYSSTQAIPYSQFLGLLKQGKIEQVQVNPEQIRGAFKSPGDGPANFVTNIVPKICLMRLQPRALRLTAPCKTHGSAPFWAGSCR